MGQVAPRRVQWVTRRKDMSHLVDRLTQAGGRLVSRSAFESATLDLDDLADAETGELSIAEFSVDPLALAEQVVTMANRLAPGDTLIIDLTGARPRVQLLPATGDQGVIVRQAAGVRRFPRSPSGFGRHNARWLAEQLAERDFGRAGAA